MLPRPRLRPQEAAAMLSQATSLAAELEQAQRNAAAAQAAVQQLAAADQQHTAELEKQVSTCSAC